MEFLNKPGNGEAAWCKMEQRCDQNRHTQHANEYQGADCDPGPCQGVTCFIVLFDSLKRYKTIHHRGNADQGTDRCAEDTGKGDGDGNAAAKDQQGEDAQDQANNGMFVCCLCDGGLFDLVDMGLVA